MQSLDAGELEAIAILLSGDCKDHLFCTGDTPAIKALGALGAASQGISFEKLLIQAKIKCGLPGYFSDEAFQRLVGQGLAEAHIYEKQ